MWHSELTQPYHRHHHYHRHLQHHRDACQQQQQQSGVWQSWTPNVYSRPGQTTASEKHHQHTHTKPDRSTHCFHCIVPNAVYLLDNCLHCLGLLLRVLVVLGLNATLKLICPSSSSSLSSTAGFTQKSTHSWGRWIGKEWNLQGKGVKIARKQKCKERPQNSQPCKFARNGICEEWTL